jgi:hypothetical protein
MDQRVGGSHRWWLTFGCAIASTLWVGSVQAQGSCGGNGYPFPYTDVASVGAAFCPGIMEAYVTGVSKGTTPTTFSPNENVTREQMTTFLQRSFDQGITRSGARAAAEQWWVPRSILNIQRVSLGVTGAPLLCKPDRDSIWVAAGNEVVRIAASDGTAIGEWFGANNAYGVLVAGGKVFVTGNTSPGVIYVIDPTLITTTVQTLATTGDPIGSFPRGIATDGANIWTANGDGSVSIITPGIVSDAVTTIHYGGFVQPYGMVFDGTSMWATDLGANKLFRFDGSGNVLQTVSTGAGPAFPVFDGQNIWVPNANDSTVTVVQASTGALVATIGSLGLYNPAVAAFDGARILVTNQAGPSATLYKAADLSFIATVPLNFGIAVPSYPYGACSDGLNFWVTDYNTGAIDRI